MFYEVSSNLFLADLPPSCKALISNPTWTGRGRYHNFIHFLRFTPSHLIFNILIVIYQEFRYIDMCIPLAWMFYEVFFPTFLADLPALMQTSGSSNRGSTLPTSILVIMLVEAVVHAVGAIPRRLVFHWATL